jgi:Mor family transcriptional regulator
MTYSEELANTTALAANERLQYPEILREFGSLLVRELVGCGAVDADRAAAIAATCIESVAGSFGGQVIYIPKASHVIAVRRWIAMFDALEGGKKVAEIGVQFGMGVHNVYRCLATVRAMNRQRAEKGLPRLSSEMAEAEILQSLKEEKA